jgi:hypothetical protein
MPAYILHGIANPWLEQNDPPRPKNTATARSTQGGQIAYRATQRSLSLCRFSDACNDERRVALRRLASEKRQGTKSREVWRRPGSERYGDLIFAPALLEGAMLAQGDLHGCAQGSLEACNGHLGGGGEGMNGRSAG